MLLGQLNRPVLLIDIIYYMAVLFGFSFVSLSLTVLHFSSSI